MPSTTDESVSATAGYRTLPHVVEDAGSIASERLTLQARDFFRGTLPVCDAYLVMELIHAWGDKEAIAILQAIRGVAPANAKVLLIEQIVPGDSRALNKRVVEWLANECYWLELDNAPGQRVWAYRKAAWAIEDLEVLGTVETWTRLNFKVGHGIPARGR